MSTDTDVTAPVTRNAWGVVARREIVTKLTDKAFVVGTLITLLVLAAFFGWSAWSESRTQDYTIAATAPAQSTAEALEKAALEELRARRPDRVLETNVEFWAAIVLDFAEVPAQMFTSMFTCARLAGWSAHILEQKKTGRLIRPSARYVGPVAPIPVPAVVHAAAR